LKRQLSLPVSMISQWWAKVGGDDDRGALVEATDKVERQLTAGLANGR
jgi:hypothetical protein